LESHNRCRCHRPIITLHVLLYQEKAKIKVWNKEKTNTQLTKNGLNSSHHDL
jgi:hypothetical protein